jgi:protein CpxP
MNDVRIGARVMRLARHGVILTLLLMGVVPRPAGAQARARGERMDRRPPSAQRLQARLDSVVRGRLQLTDEQFAQLRGVATRLEEDRRLLRRDEMAVRVRLRRALAAAEMVDQGAVAQLLDEIPRLERRKVELLEEEQRELARFLSPSQRARYFALQEEMRRGMLELQRRRLGLDSTPGRR